MSWMLWRLMLLVVMVWIPSIYIYIPENIIKKWEKYVFIILKMVSEPI